MSQALSSTGYVTIATFEHLAAGESALAYLASQGIAGQLRDERRLQRWWFLAPPHAGIHVDVPEHSKTDARDHLRRWLVRDSNRGRVLEHPIACPECGSGRIQYPNMTRFFILPTLIAHLLTLLRITEPECYCEECHHTWIPQPSEPPGAAA